MKKYFIYCIAISTLCTAQSPTIPISELDRAQPIFEAAPPNLAQRFNIPPQPISKKQKPVIAKGTAVEMPLTPVLPTQRLAKSSHATIAKKTSIENPMLQSLSQIALQSMNSLAYKQQQVRNSLDTRYTQIAMDKSANPNELADALQHFSQLGLKTEIEQVLNHKNADKIREYILLRAIENIAFYGYDDVVKNMINNNAKVKRSISKFLGKALEGAAGAGDDALVLWILQHNNAKRMSKKDLDRAESAAKYYNHANIVEQLNNFQKKS